jgi:hypothetical protein
MPIKFTVTESIFIAASPEEVWKFTHNDLHHPFWSDLCINPKIVESQPFRLVRFYDKGRLQGVWTYEANGDGTVWTQANTLSLERPMIRFLGPLFKFRLSRRMRTFMRKVKETMEFSEELSGSLHEDFF